MFKAKNKSKKDNKEVKDEIFKDEMGKELSKEETKEEIDKQNIELETEDKIELSKKEENNKEDVDDSDELIMSTGKAFKAKKYEILAYVDEEESAKKFVELLKYSGIKDCKFEYGKISGAYEIFVTPQSYELANNIYKQVLSDKVIEGIENEAINEDIDEDELDEIKEEAQEEILEVNTTSAFREPVLYESKEEKYKDNLSSAFTFIICGIIGVAVLVLNDVGVLKLVTTSSSSFIVINVVLGILFVLFLGIGIWSLVYSKKLKKLAKEESNKIKEITEFLEENVLQDEIDEEVNIDIPDELKFYNRVDYVKSVVKKEFEDYEDDLLSHVSEKYIEALYN